MADVKPKKTISRRSAARLAAVQALYDIDITGADVATVLDDVQSRRWPDVESEDGGPSPVPQPDKVLLRELVTGVRDQIDDLDGMINAALTNDWTTDRLEVLLRAILRAGTFELLSRGDINARVVITEYLDMAHVFYDGPEPKMVNGILDRLAHKLRETEFDSN